MKRLSIIRHGKAANNEEAVDDRERPLLKKGRKDLSRLTRPLPEAHLDGLFAAGERSPAPVD